MISTLQKNAWTQLIGKLDRLPHALLLHGAPGVGKLALAERFAQLLLCEKRGTATEPCGACEGCRWFLAGNHPDVRFVEPETMPRHAAVAEEGEEEGSDEGGKSKRKPSNQIRIEQTRALRGFLNVGSHRGGRRVAIVHPAEDMNTATANSLLKGLEEPPPGAIFLLVSHRPARLLPTIRSRCVPVPVPLPEPKAAAAWLAAQGVRSAERWLAFAGGAPLRALDYATGERGAAIERVLRGIAAADRNAAIGSKGPRRTRTAGRGPTEDGTRPSLCRAFRTHQVRRRRSAGRRASLAGLRPRDGPQPDADAASAQPETVRRRDGRGHAGELACDGGRLCGLIAVALLLAVSGAAGAASYDEFLKAVNDGDVKTVGAFLGQGLDPNTADKDGNTVLMIASRLGHAELVAYLIDHKASVTKRSPHGDTALMFACLGGHLEVAKILVIGGAPIAQSGWAPLHYAAFDGHPAVIKFLLEKGADKNGLGPNGYTPLMLAARGGFTEAARVLLYADADLSIKGPKGETAMAIAREKKNDELASLLKRAGAVD